MKIALTIVLVVLALSACASNRTGPRWGNNGTTPPPDVASGTAVTP